MSDVVIIIIIIIFIRRIKKKCLSNYIDIYIMFSSKGLQNNMHIFCCCCPSMYYSGVYIYIYIYTIMSVIIISDPIGIIELIE